MSYEFFIKQDGKNKLYYVKLLEVTGSLSNLFAESNNPFLYYRAMENIFCKAFKAENLSRSDVSVDASKNGLGIGLKTFLQNNGSTFQKVAEFNKESYLFKNLDSYELIKKVSQLRNERINATKRICNLEDVMYHMVTRSENQMSIYEEHMDLVDIDNIELTKKGNSTIHFTDNIHMYSFNISKSTLLKKFDTTENRKICSFNVEILEDPYDFLLSSKQLANTKKVLSGVKKEKGIDYIILPLYSPRTQKVEERSGLNQWNARGRVRHPDEVYISIPSWIHKVKKNFFKYNTIDFKTESFNVKLPNGRVISMKVAQEGGKALMSNPNSALGNWILRDILRLKENEIVTKEQLDIIGIDSVMLTKIKEDEYILDFLKSGSYDEFEDKYNKKN